MRLLLPRVPAAAVCLLLCLAACAMPSAISNLGNNTYAVTVTAAEGGPILRQRAVDIAKDRCIDGGRSFYVISENTEPTANGFALTLTFKCLKGDDPLMRGPDTFKTN